MDNVCGLALNALASHGHTALDNYAACLTEVFEAHPPPHGTAWYRDVYRHQIRNPEWFTNSLIYNAEMEGIGSRRVWKFSSYIPDQRIADMVRAHSMDESRHSRMFIGILDTIFPSQIEADYRKRLRDLSPGYTKRSHPTISPPSPDTALSERRVIANLIGSNLVEVRALVLQYMLRPVMLAYGKPEQRDKLTRISDRLISDEIKHIAYSAHCIEQYSRKGDLDWLRAKMLEQQISTNTLTMQDLDMGQLAP